MFHCCRWSDSDAPSMRFSLGRRGGKCLECAFWRGRNRTGGAEPEPGPAWTREPGRSGGERGRVRRGWKPTGRAGSQDGGMKPGWQGWDPGVAGAGIRGWRGLGSGDGGDWDPGMAGPGTRGWRGLGPGRGGDWDPGMAGTGIRGWRGLGPGRGGAWDLGVAGPGTWAWRGWTGTGLEPGARTGPRTGTGLCGPRRSGGGIWRRTRPAPSPGPPRNRPARRRSPSPRPA
jgi:hypothetical protein